MTNGPVIERSLAESFRAAMERGRIALNSAPCGFGKSVVSRALLEDCRVRELSADGEALTFPADDGTWDVLLLDELQNLPDSGQEPLCALLRTAVERRFVLLSRGGLPGWLGQRYEHFACRRIARCGFDFYGVSADTCRWLQTFGIQAAGTLPNAVDPDELAQAACAENRVDWRKTVPAGTRLAAFVGRLIPEKGALPLAQAVLSLPDWSLVIAGTGPQLDELQQLAQQSGGGNVRRVGAGQEQGIVPAGQQLAGTRRVRADNRAAAGSRLQQSRGKPFGVQGGQAVAVANGQNKRCWGGSHGKPCMKNCAAS